MRRLPVWTILTLILLAGCESTGQSGTPQQRGRPCTTRVQDAGQCDAGSIYVFPELTNVR
jgi:hypothetical protein